MVTINFGIYEPHDIITYLEELKVYKIKNRPKKTGNKRWDSTDYDIDRINHLINRLKYNNYKQEYIVQTTAYKEKISTERNFYDSEEAKERYKKIKREKMEII